MSEIPNSPDNINNTELNKIQKIDSLFIDVLRDSEGELKNKLLGKDPLILCETRDEVANNVIAVKAVKEAGNIEEREEKFKERLNDALSPTGLSERQQAGLVGALSASVASEWLKKDIWGLNKEHAGKNIEEIISDKVSKALESTLNDKYSSDIRDAITEAINKFVEPPEEDQVVHLKIVVSDKNNYKSTRINEAREYSFQKLTAMESEDVPGHLNKDGYAIVEDTIPNVPLSEKEMRMIVQDSYPMLGEEQVNDYVTKIFSEDNLKKNKRKTLSEIYSDEKYLKDKEYNDILAEITGNINKFLDNYNS